MYRGDDVSSRFWPLDEQNTLGAGIAYEQGDHQTRFHLGVHRLNDPFQIQTIKVPISEFGTEMSPIWAKRGIITLRHQALMNLDSSTGMKWVVYSEGHGLPSGTYREDDLDIQNLPSDWGFLIGGSSLFTASVSRTSSISL